MIRAVVGMSHPQQCEYHLTDQDDNEIDPRLDLRNHSPTGVSWGYAGSGPAQCALAILAHFWSDELALKYYQAFKAEVIAQAPDNFILSADFVDEWLREHSE